MDLLERLKQSTFMFSRPGEITAALSKLNAMKRRLGGSATNSTNPVQAVMAFTTKFPLIKERWYLATRLSIDHYLLSTWNHDQLDLQFYADFLIRELVMK